MKQSWITKAEDRYYAYQETLNGSERRIIEKKHTMGMKSDIRWIKIIKGAWRINREDIKLKS